MESIPQVRKVFIYALIDPCTNEVRYVGKAKNTKARLRSHLKRCRLAKTHRDCWLLGLKQAGLRPLLTVIEESDSTACNDRERYWIAKYGRADQGKGNLTNKTDGGDGTFGYVHPRSIIERIAAKNRGRKCSAESRSAISAGLRGRKYSPATLARMSAWQKGRPLPEWHRLKIIAAMQNYDPSLESRAKMSAATKGKPKSPEHRAKIAAALRGLQKSPEHCRRMSDAMRGKQRGPLSEQHKANCKAGRIHNRSPEITARAMNVIRLLSTGMKGRDIARATGFSFQSVSAIRTGKLFADLKRGAESLDAIRTSGVGMAR